LYDTYNSDDHGEETTMSQVHVAVSSARSNLSELLHQVQLLGDRVVLERRGKQVGAIVSVEDLELLERIEDKMDLATIRKRIKEPRLSLDAVVKRLGLDR